MNNAVFGKIMGNVRKHKHIKLLTAKRKKLFNIDANFHTEKFFTETLLTIETRKTQILMNMANYLDLSVLDLSKFLMHEFLV